MLLFRRLSCRAVAATALLTTLAGSVPAASVSLWQSTRYATPDETQAGVPADGIITDFFVTSDTDLLSVSRVEVTAPLYQHALGSDSAAPHAALAAIDAAITADSFITLPSSTVTLGGGFGVGGDRMWGDLSNDGPAANFNFARLTSSTGGAFTGRVAVRGYERAEYVPFEFQLPSPGDDLALFNARPALTFNYSLDPPPAPPQSPPPVSPPPPTSWPPTVAPPSPPLQTGPPAIADPPYVGPSGLGSISLTRRSREVTAAEALGGAPAAGLVHEFFVTSTTDILSVNRVNVTSPLFQHSLGSDSEAPMAELIPASAGLTADSFLTTPGETHTLGAGLAGTLSDGVWGDFTNDGGQIEFRLGQLTVAETGTFSGAISFRGPEGPLKMPFSFELPGTLADLAALQQSEGLADTTLSMQFALDAASRPTPTPSVPPPPVAEQPPSVAPPVAADPPQADDPAPRPELPPALPELPNSDVPDVIVGEPVPPAYEQIIGEQIKTFPIWTFDPPRWDGALVTIDHLLRTFLLVDADGTTHSVSTRRFDALDRVGTMRSLSVGDSLLTFTSAPTAAEAPIPEPTTASLALAVVATLFVARRRP
jgi:hypothetical protein